MDQGIALVVVAVITAVGGIIVAVIQSSRRENRRDHASVAAALLKLHNASQKASLAIGRVEVKLDRHLLDHEKGEHDGIARRDT
jgi:hypothetical protein